MTKKIFDVVAIVGKRKDDKPNYVNCGVVLEKDNGKLSMKLETLPLGNQWDGWLQLFEPKPRGEKPAQAQPSDSAPPPGDFDDDMPF